jgi:NodT family efflux transporter outer membrane factor (OMF) lipoprotein
MVGPKYSPPEIQMSDEWTGELDDPELLEAPVTKWWELFDDPLLDKYIVAAEKNNYDILAAEANILRARALRMVNASNLFPQVSANFIPMRIDFSKNGPFFGGVEKKVAAAPFARVFNLFNAFFDATWELDLFGKTRYAVRQAEAMIDSAIEQKNDTLISTYAEVARNYVELRSFQTKKELLEQMIALYEKNALIMRKNFEEGYANRLDVINIESALETTKAALPEMIAEIYRSIYSLSILTGQLPEALVEELIEPKPLPKTPKMVAIGLRSDLLRRRPDIRRAERDLAAATANVGVSVASFFPTITLFGLGGFQALKLPELFDWNSKIWTFGADVNMPIFQGGKMVGHLRFTQAEQSAAAFAYQNTVLQAIQEAESSLISYKQQLHAAIDLSQAVSSNELATAISRERFGQGLVNKIEFLNAERQLVQARLNSLSSDTAALLSFISLYKALGGGWEELDY